MNRVIAGALRATGVGVVVLAVFVVVVGLPGWVLGVGLGQVGVLLPFVAATICAMVVMRVLGPVDRLVERLTQHRGTTPYSALAEAAARIRSGSPDSALPGLAEVLAEGTGAQRAVVWLAVSDRLVPAAVHPATGEDLGTAQNLAVLLERPDTDHVVPVVDGTELRAVLAIGKPGSAITPADQQLMRDLAGGAGMLLRGVAMNTELRERVRRADELARELARSRERLTSARDVERRRLVGELSHATTDRLSALRIALDGAREDLLSDAPDARRARAALDRARTGLEELLDRFRVIARGVYPAVLRDQGPANALDEVAADLDRDVDLRGGSAGRLSWEVESGIYYVAASAMQRLAERPGPALTVELSHSEGRFAVRVVDPEPSVSAGELRATLAGELERLAALGGDAGVAGEPGGALVLVASLPERLEPLVDVIRAGRA
ncbi:MAG: hypothetical protein OJJ54_16660 [Pseudonocardia sp.]|nr:hypothetical protein [Pseudonocardia sp.]